jgi:phosphatidylserine/phosphatidylglycerophosphate/cardiolipin synthase-like enzyme
MSYRNLSLLLLVFLSFPVFANDSSPQDQEVCFSPDETCDEKLISFVGKAEKSIDMAIYDINLDQLVHKLLVQSKKLKVRIVVDQRQSKGSHSLVSTLIKGGADVRYGHQRGIMHDKFTIVDGKMIETGSFNYTNHATQANQENQVYLASKSVVSRYQERFEHIWETAKSAGDVGPRLSQKKDHLRRPSSK